MSNQLYSGKTVVITGAGSGIGQAMAVAFAQAGASLAVLDLNQEQLSETLDLLISSNAKASGFACDVSQSTQVQSAVDKIQLAFGSIDVWINNAGIAHVGNIEATAEADLDRLYNVNIKGVYNGMLAVLPIMKQQNGGAILNMASIAAKVGIADRFAYSMTKGAVLTMSLSVAKDYVTQNIRCNCICPARVHTPFVDGFIAKNYPGQEREVFDNLAAYQPIGRMGEPAEIAQLALFLCSDNAKFITASAYDIDGGVTSLR